jgi:hypothetical protein
MTYRTPLLGAAVVALGLGLAACDTSPKPPAEQNVCYKVQVDEKDPKKVEFFEVARNVPGFEQCAAELEAVRLRFIMLGSPNREITGAYNGQFLFLDPGGVSVGQSLNGGRFVALARTGDGRLVVPSYMPQPGQEPPTVAETAPAAEKAPPPAKK